MVEQTLTRASGAPVLSPELLARCHERAPTYDRENRFFHEDFEELRAAGYLTMAVPEELGGLGLTAGRGLPRTAPPRLPRAGHRARDQHAPLLDGHRGRPAGASGDRSLEWLLEEAVARRGLRRRPRRGRQRPAGPAVDGARRAGRRRLPVLRPQDRSAASRRSGPAWASTRWTPATRTPRRSSTRSCRATRRATRSRRPGTRSACAPPRSDDTILDGAFVPDRYIARVVPAGASGVDQFVLAIFAWALLGFGNVYYGLAQRALDLTLASVKTKKSIALSRPMAYHAARPARDRRDGHGPGSDRSTARADGAGLVEWRRPWRELGRSRSSARNTTPSRPPGESWTRRWSLAGGFGIFKANEIERLFRDARLGRIHPANAALAHEFVAKTALGINRMSSRAGGEVRCQFLDLKCVGLLAKSRRRTLPKPASATRVRSRSSPPARAGAVTAHGERLGHAIVEAGGVAERAERERHVPAGAEMSR